MTICGACGTEATMNATFCPECGTKLTGSSSQPVQSSQPSQSSQPTQTYQPRPHQGKIQGSQPRSQPQFQSQSQPGQPPSWQTDTNTRFQMNTTQKAPSSSSNTAALNLVIAIHVFLMIFVGIITLILFDSYENDPAIFLLGILVGLVLLTYGLIKHHNGTRVTYILLTTLFSLFFLAVAPIFAIPFVIDFLILSFHKDTVALFTNPSS